ncbi:hypothetical protein ILUMI_26432, partial [Ignelater luminosus]
SCGSRSRTEKNKNNKEGGCGQSSESNFGQRLFVKEYCRYVRTQTPNIGVK